MKAIKVLQAMPRLAAQAEGRDLARHVEDHSMVIGLNHEDGLLLVEVSKRFHLINEH